MRKYLHLHDKIKLAREILGLKQKDFIVRVSKQMKQDGTLPADRKDLSAGLASQWESRRTTPGPEHISAIAKLTKNPELYLLWFLQDDVPANRAINLHPDGDFYLPSESEDDPGHGAPGPTATAPTTPFFDEVTAWKTNPQAITKIRNDLMLSWPRDVRESYLARLKQLDSKDKEDSAPIISGSDSRHDYDDQSSQSQSQTVDVAGVEAKAALGAVTAAVDTAENSDSTPAQVQGTPVNKLIEAARPICIRDLVDYPAKGPLEQVREQQLSDKDARAERRLREDQFFEVLKYHLADTLGVIDIESHIRRPITSGVFKTRADVYLFGVSVDICFLEPSMPARFFGFSLMESMEHLLMVDRMQGKQFKKTVLYCTHESKALLPRLIDFASDFITSAQGLAINVGFAAGAAQAAQEIANLVEQTFDDT